MNTYPPSVVDVSQYLDLATTRKERKMSFTNGIASLNLPLIAPVETGSHDSDIDETDVMCVFPIEGDPISTHSNDGYKSNIVHNYNGDSVTTLTESAASVCVVSHKVGQQTATSHISSDGLVISQTAILNDIGEGGKENGNGSDEADLVVAFASGKNDVLDTRGLRQVLSAIDVSTSQRSTKPEASASPGSDSHDCTTDEDEVAVPEEPTHPVTPQVQRATDGTSTSTITKTPTFANGTLSDVKKPRNGRNSRRRADTPHPAATSSAGESTATTPQTTPDKPAKAPRKRRYSRKSKGEGPVNDRPLSSHESGTKVDEVESPLARKSTRQAKSRRPSENVLKSEDLKEPEAKGTPSADAVKQVPSEEIPIPLETPQINKPSSPADALALDIDYPSFQTTEILEFETYSPQTPAPQASDPSVEAHIVAVNEEETKDEDTEKSKPTRSRKPNTFTRRFRGPRTPPKRPDLKPAAEEGIRPALAILFEEYGVRFRSDRRPHLQYGALAHEAEMKNPDINLCNVREEFDHAFQMDCQSEWPAHEITMSPIDQYFAKCEVRWNFQYNPKAEASAEFQRLALEAGWIEEIMMWDIENWEDSLERFEALWSSRVARAERKKFKYSCFAELDRSVGHIFFRKAGKPTKNDASSDPDTAPSGQHWDLDDYHHFLDCFDEPHLDTTEACREHIGETLNINLYDLLDWLRNPCTAARPDKFPDIKELGNYSYSQNKVFPRYYAAASKIASPLLRPIGRFGQRSHVRHRNTHYRRWHDNPESGTRAPKSNGKSRKGKKKSGQETKGKDPMKPTTAEERDTAMSADAASVNEKGTGASLFAVSGSIAHGSDLKSHRVPFRTRRGSVMSERLSEKVVAPLAGQAIAVVA